MDIRCVTLVIHYFSIAECILVLTDWCLTWSQRFFHEDGLGVIWIFFPYCFCLGLKWADYRIEKRCYGIGIKAGCLCHWTGVWPCCRIGRQSVKGTFVKTLTVLLAFQVHHGDILGGRGHLPAIPDSTSLVNAFGLPHHLASYIQHLTSDICI